MSSVCRVFFSRRSRRVAVIGEADLLRGCVLVSGCGRRAVRVISQAATRRTFSSGLFLVRREKVRRKTPLDVALVRLELFRRWTEQSPCP